MADVLQPQPIGRRHESRHTHTGQGQGQGPGSGLVFHCCVLHPLVLEVRVSSHHLYQQVAQYHEQNLDVLDGSSSVVDI